MNIIDCKVLHLTREPFYCLQFTGESFWKGIRKWNKTKTENPFWFDSNHSHLFHLNFEFLSFHFYFPISLPPLKALLMKYKWNKTSSTKHPPLSLIPLFLDTIPIFLALLVVRLSFSLLLESSKHTDRHDTTHSLPSFYFKLNFLSRLPAHTSNNILSLVPSPHSSSSHSVSSGRDAPKFHPVIPSLAPTSPYLSLYTEIIEPKSRPATTQNKLSPSSPPYFFLSSTAFSCYWQQTATKNSVRG